MTFWKNGSKEHIIQAAKLIAFNLGDNCEVLVCESFDRLFFRVVHVENALFGHEAGDIFPNLRVEDLAEDPYCEVRSRSDGKTLRICAVPLRGTKQNLAGVIITILDISQIVFVQNWLSNLTGRKPSQTPTQCDDVAQLMDLIIEQASIAIGKPVSHMNRDDKKQFIGYLDERGVFQIKKSSEKVAGFLDVSKFTLYACLEEIRAKKTNFSQ